jgi:demethylmenaquinone methyltransferase / 2-methoxy-6-polyprenyl-1,4-benzoquinol methylase
MGKYLREKYPKVKEVTDADRIGMVKEIFSTVPAKYDFLNHFLSLRRDVAWRRFAARRMRFFQTWRLLDVATGTADLAMDAAKMHPLIRVTGVDFVREMMDLGRVKIEKRGISDRVEILRADALDLPFPDSSFDVAAVAFGIRNIPDRIRALREMARVVVPGGQVMVLEMTYPENRVLRGIYGIYLGRLLPVIARQFSRNPAAYHYLADSIMNFPSPDAFARLMENAGLARIEKHPLTLGVTYLHIGIKPDR